MIELKNLTRKTASGASPDGTDVLFRNSRIYGIVGGEGAGKSTLLATVAGALTPADGQVLISGYNVHTQPKEAKRRLGYMPSPMPLPLDMTVGEYLAFVAEVKGLRDDRRERRIREVLKATDLLDLRESLIASLPPDRRAALALAQAAVADPDVLLLDEPCKGLDGQAARDLRSMIRHLATDRTVLITAEDALSLSGICDVLLTLENGRIVDEVIQDKTEEVDA